MLRETRNSIEDIWGPRTPYEGEGNWPQRIDEHLDEEPQRWVQSACVLCANGCALDIGVKDNRIVGVRGRGVDRVNRGRLGPKGMYGWRANHSSDRLTRPLIRAGDNFRAASWDEAMALIVRHAQEVRDKYTGDAVGFYSSGQLFLEESYTLSLIAHAGLSTNHIDGNTRLCTATASAAMRETFGTDGQPCSYADIDVTDSIFIIGTDMALTKTVLWMRLLDRRRGPRPPRLVVVDPRATATAREADVHLAPRAGTNVTVLNGLLNLVIQNGGVDRAFVEQHPVGYGKLEQIVRNYPPGRVRDISGISIDKLRAAAETAADVCESYGHDLETGASVSEEEYRANDLKGRAILKGANYLPPPEDPDKEYPFWLTTGRLVYHFHTRTKTGRCRELQQAAPESFVEMASEDAQRLGIQEDDIVEVSSRRGTAHGPARLGDILPGHLFIPFHYGYWDEKNPDYERAANELTMTVWDPVSKQPLYKMAAVQVRKAGAMRPAVSRDAQRSAGASALLCASRLTT